MTATMIGMVMNGPMPHICVMLIAVPENSPIDRRKPALRTGLPVSAACLLISATGMSLPV